MMNTTARLSFHLLRLSREASGALASKLAAGILRAASHAAERAAGCLMMAQAGLPAHDQRAHQLHISYTGRHRAISRRVSLGRDGVARLLKASAARCLHKLTAPFPRRAFAARCFGRRQRLLYRAEDAMMAAFADMADFRQPRLPARRHAPGRLLLARVMRPRRRTMPGALFSLAAYALRAPHGHAAPRRCAVAADRSRHTNATAAAFVVTPMAMSGMPILRADVFADISRRRADT